MLSIERRSPKRGEPSPPEADTGDLRSVVVFFAMAYVLAWSVWFGLGALAGGTGLTTGDLVGHVEAGRFDRVADIGPGWLLYPLTRIMDFSFTIAGLVMIIITGGRAGLRQLADRLTRWRFPLRWYCLALAPLLLYLVAGFLANRAEGGTVAIDGSTIPTVLWSLEAGVLVSLLLRGAMGEELGLRGFALPLLQQHWSPARAAFVVGIGWALWHLPVLIDDPATAPIIVLLIIGLSFIMTWLFNGTGGSLVGPLLFHAVQNAEEAIETILPAIVGTDWETIAALGLLALGALAAVVVRRNPDRPTIPNPAEHQRKAHQ